MTGGECPHGVCPPILAIPLAASLRICPSTTGSFVHIPCLIIINVTFAHLSCLVTVSYVSIAKLSSGHFPHTTTTRRTPGAPLNWNNHTKNHPSFLNLATAELGNVSEVLLPYMSNNYRVQPCGTLAGTRRSLCRSSCLAACSLTDGQESSKCWRCGHWGWQHQLQAAGGTSTTADHSDHQTGAVTPPMQTNHSILVTDLLDCHRSLPVSWASLPHRSAFCNYTSPSLCHHQPASLNEVNLIFISSFLSHFNSHRSSFFAN